MSMKSAAVLAFSAAIAISRGSGQGTGLTAAADASPRELAAAAPPESGAPLPAYSGEMDSGLKKIVKAVLADVVRRTGRDASALQVVSAEAVTWPDGSLGCPQPGMSYTMALVPGYRVRIQAGAELLDYHANRRGYFVLCPQGQASEPPGLESK